MVCDTCGKWKDDEFCEICYVNAFAAIRAIADSLPKVEFLPREEGMERT